MKHQKNTILLVILIIGIAMFCASRIQWPIAVDKNWSQPVIITGSTDTFWEWLYLYKFQNTIMCLQPNGKGSARCFFLMTNSWVESRSMNFPKDYFLQNLALNQNDNSVMLSDGEIKNEQIIMKVFTGTLTEDGLQNIAKTQWTIGKKALFGETSASVQFGGADRYNQGSLTIGVGVINGAEIYIPYSVNAVTITTAAEDRPFNIGAFHSSDSGKTWQMEQISNFETWVDAICKTKNYYYYFGNEYSFWASRKPVAGNNWESPFTLTKTLGASWRGNIRMLADDDTIHACWTDSRHNMWRFPSDTPRENDDIVYRHRRDSDSSWSKGKILSKGLVYCFPPAMSVEGNKIVVVWAGSPTSDRDHSQGDPNDIFYVTSKDNGDTWTKPVKVTDNAKDGLDSGTPQVMLLNGVIHLFYIQGKPWKHEPLSDWTRPGWPIYYKQRPFPN